MSLPQVIQGGMGVGVSGWKLARAVSQQNQLGVVSGTGINSVMIRRLQDGDHEGHVRRALAHFPDQTVSQKVLEEYFIPGGRSEGQPYKRCATPTAQPSLFLNQLNVVGSFVEVWLAKEGHDGLVGINFLEKIQVALLPGIYGAMLAGVDYVLVGAGIPREVPGVLDLFAKQQDATLKLNVLGATSEQEFRVEFSPARVFPEMALAPMKRPRFIGIISSTTLAIHLAKKATGKVDGFVIEGWTAGGHNAPPRGALNLDETGQPVYGDKDLPDLATIQALGLPFWLAGSFGSPEKLRLARSLGAVGVQVGTAFAFCEESGLKESIKRTVIDQWCSQRGEAPVAVYTDPLASPTGFPFKVAPVNGTLSDPVAYAARPRKCDLGYLRQLVAGPDGKLVYRCPAEPVEDYVRKGGNAADTVNRKCLCNALMSNVGLGQIQTKSGGAPDYSELPLITAGDDLIHLNRYLPEGERSYSARQVVELLLSG